MIHSTSLLSGPMTGFILHKAAGAETNDSIGEVPLAQAPLVGRGGKYLQLCSSRLCLFCRSRPFVVMKSS